MNLYTFTKTFLIALFIFCPFTTSAQFQHQLTGEKYPWSVEPKIDGESFRFVIIGDLTGAEKPGYFSQAVERINDLAPDFVISVGDLIDGYVICPEAANAQWKSFNDRLSKLKSPFFYVAGNHDTTCEMLEDQWIERYGYTYYSFTIGDYLFLITNNMETGVQSGTSKEQALYFKEQIEAHDPSKPIILFGHRPTWTKHSEDGLKDFMPLLYERNTTYFCGHIHRYRNFKYKGQDHYLLANITRDTEYTENNQRLGLFNNLMQVTIKNGEMSIANIALSGLLDREIVNNNNTAEVEMINSQKWLNIKPTVAKEDKIKELNTEVTINNKANKPFNFTIKADVPDGFSISNNEIEGVVDAGSSLSFDLTLKSFSKKCDVRSIPPINFVADGYFVMEDGYMLKSNTINKEWKIDYYHRVTGRSTELKMIEDYSYVRFDWDWQGCEDGALLYAVYHDNDSVYCKLKTQDDIYLEDQHLADAIILSFASDTTFMNKEFIRVKIDPSNPKMDIKGVDVECSLNGEAIEAMVKIPKKMLSYDALRLNFSFIDFDIKENDYTSQIWWKPNWLSSDDYPGSGVFILE